MKSRSLPYVMALVAAAAVLAAVWVVDRLEQERFREANRTSVIQRLSTVRARLEGSLNSRLFLTRGLVGYVSTHPGIEEREFQALAKVLLAGQSAIRSIELAKNTVVTHIYPVDGNEKARGLRLLDLPNQRAAVQRALDTRDTVVAGPVDLVEGGVAFVSRTPIYLTPPGGPPASGRYWGLATILVDKDFLLEEAGLFDDSAGLQYGLRGKDGLGTQGEIFFGNSALFESHPVVLDVYLPNGSWQLAAVPVGGWAAVSPQVWPVRVGGGLLALLAAGLAYMVTLYQVRLAERKEALRRAHNELERRVEERAGTLSRTVEILENQIAVRQEAERALRESRERFRQLAETTNAIPWEADAKTWQFTYVGPQALEILGYPPEQWCEKDFWVAHIHPDDREWAVEFCKKSSSSMKDYEFEYRMISADGRIVWLHDIVSVESISGAPKTLRGFMMDITGRKQAEEDLQRGEERFRRVLETAPDGIVLVRPDGTMAFVNEQMERLFGYTSEELVGQGVEMLALEGFSTDQAQQRRGNFGDSSVRPRGSGLELYGRRKDGSEVPVEIRLSPLEAPEGVLVCAAIRDVTERKRAEETLRKRTEQIIRHQAVLLKLARMDNSDLLAAQKRITEEDAKMLGVERVSIWLFNEDRSGIACQDLYRLSRNAHEKGLRLQAGQYPRYFQALEENRVVAANDAQSDPRTNEFTEGYLKPFEITSMMDVPVWLHGKVVGIVCHEHTGPIREWKPEEQEFAASIADLVSLTLEAAERKRAEEALRNLTGRLIGAQEEERRRIARELHDDLTQRLAVLAIEAGKLEKQLGSSSSPVRERLQTMSEQIVKLSADVHGIARQLHPSVLDDLGLVKAIESECASYSGRERISVTFEARNAPAALPKDLALCLYRVTQESLRNIAKHARVKEARVSLASMDGEIRLSIHDEGIGFDLAQVGGKPGLGLASMEERVRLIHGDLSVKSQPGQGTVIEVRVPLTGRDR